MRPGTARTLGWLGAVLAAGLTLRLAGTGQLAAPPLGSVTDLTVWAGDRSPAAAAISVVRLLAETTAWYVLGVSALHALARLLRSARVGRTADSLMPPSARRLVHAGLGVGLAAATVTPAGSGTAERGTARMDPVLVPAEVGAPDGRSGTATMRPVPGPARPAATPAPPAADAPAPTGPSTWRVEPGDSLWSIAAEVLADTWGRPAADREIDPFWRALVERNRPRLLDPADPDLIHPGQVLELAPVPSPPA